MKTLRQITSFLFILALVIDANAQDSLKILSWNVQMLPRFINANGKTKRARAIVVELNKTNYDVIVFQEMFKKRSRRIITRGLSASFPHHTPVLNKKTLSFRTNGGVMIFSRHPIGSFHQIEYKNRMGFDKYSRKGAMLAELNVRGRSMQVIGTHLQAFGDQEIMYKQYEQLAGDLINPHARPGVPQFICGDFNTIKTIPAQPPAGVSQNVIASLPRYMRMIESLDAQDGDLKGDQQFTMDRPYNDLCKKRKEFRLLLDYILVRTPGLNTLSINRQIVIMRKLWHKRHQDLSDHFGLEAVASGF